ELYYSLKSDFRLGIGREGRIILLSVSIGAYYFHQYLLFYGLGILALVSFYDITGLVKQLSREV
ncbi:MAG: hypothetical protein BRC28_03580, partial [Nanohaloarchaea archaeon SW_4_43_9]